MLIMVRIKAIIYIFFFLFTQNIFAQIDTISFEIIPDVGNAYKVSCQAYKVSFGTTDTTYTAFELSDTVNSAYTLNWAGDVAPTSEANIHQSTYLYTAPGTYDIVLTVTEASSGNTFTATEAVTIEDLIHVPNVFTPNDDGINDLFVVRANGIEPIEIFIYSRTGTLVFKDKAPILVWDGRNASGSKVSQGIYYYILKPSDPAHQEQKGFFHVFPDENK